MRIFVTRVNDIFQQKTPINVRKSMTVGELKRQIQDHLKIPPKQQRLFYGGKQLENKNSLLHYNLDTDKIVLLATSLPSNNQSNQSNQSKTTSTPETSLSPTPDDNPKVDQNQNDQFEHLEVVESHFFRENDVVDCWNPQDKGWFEARYQRSLQGPEQVFCEVLFFYSDQVRIVPEDDVRPRSKRLLKVRDIQLGQTVLVQNVWDENIDAGSWFDFKVQEVLEETKKKKKMVILKGQLVSDK